MTTKTSAGLMWLLVRNRRTAIVVALLLVALASWAAYEDALPGIKPLVASMPAGAILYIESPDFGALLHDWNNSTEKQAWLKSDNYEVFSRSRLFGRLGEAQQEYAAAATLPADMQFLAQIAGKESALGVYEIGALQFLYMTHMPDAQSARTALLQSRGKFETRKSGDATFYVRTTGDGEQGGAPRTVAFATYGDSLLLATREDLIARALALMQNQKEESLGSEAWYAAVTAAAEKPGDLRMAMDLSRIVRSPYFRSYWIQQNITEMGHFQAAISDLYRTGDEFREERVLLPKSIDDSSVPQADLGQIAALVPPVAGFYRAEAAPAVSDMIAALDSRLLSRSGSAYKNRYEAPQAADTPGAADSQGDLEMRIDAPPIAAAPKGAELAALRKMLEDRQPRAMLVIDGSVAKRDDIFVSYHAAVVLESETKWDAQAAGEALKDALRPKLSTGDLGLRWQPRRGYFELDGAQPLYFAVAGKYFLAASDEGLLSAVLNKIADGAPPGGEPVLRVSGFNHEAERANFARASRLIDLAAVAGQDDGADNTPRFFSGNIASLSNTFAPMQSETIREYWANGALHQSVSYKWKRSRM